MNTSTEPRELEIDKAYLIRTVTMMYTGKVVAVSNFCVTLAAAAWIADSGRYSNALITGELSEVEVYPNGCCVTLGSMVDFAPWDHPLPTKTI